MKRAYKDLQEFIQVLEDAGELIRIQKEVDSELEISEIYLRHSKAQDGGKAILFENVKNSSIPVLINAFGSYKRLSLAFGAHSLEDFMNELKSLVQIEIPEGFWGTMKKGWQIKDVLKYPPKRLSSRSASCQQVIYRGDEVDLSKIPVIKCWPDDGGPFVTLPLVFTKSLDGKKKNMGLYRMQIYDKNTTGMHWQIHKDGSHFHGEYRKASKRMEVAVAIGADPASVYSGTAPLPPGVYEMFFAGFLRGSGAEMVKCVSVDLEVPAHAEIVLEGYIDPDELRDEGPFGDHTGYYTPIEPYPVFHVTTVTMKRNPVYLTTVVGRSPMEDCYLAYATERLFLPLLQAIAPEVIDQHLPWDGNFHNCQIFRINKEYPYQGRRLMSHIWGFTQASFCKCLITASEEAPIHNDEEFLEYFLNNLNVERDVFVTEGIVDALDHSANQRLFGGKLGIDISLPIHGEPGFGEKLEAPEPVALQTEWLDKELAILHPAITGCLSFGMQTRNPVLLLRVHKESNPGIAAQLSQRIFETINLKPFKIFVLVDEKNRDLSDGHMIMWRIFNNTDAQRDLYREGDRALFDATYKLPEEGYNREWPPDMFMDQEVIEKIDSDFSSIELGL